MSERRPAVGSFSDRLVKMKDEKELTLRAIGDAVGVSEAAVSKWTHGTVPDGENVTKLARFLGCDAGWLLFGDPAREVKWNLGASLPPPRPVTAEPLPVDWLAAGLAEELNRVLARFRAETGREVAGLRLADGRVVVELRG